MNEEAIAFDDGEEGAPAAPVETAPETPPAPEATETAPKIEFTAEQQAKFNDEIGKKVAKQREAERLVEEERTKREAAEAELNRLKAPQRPVIPEPPEQYDDDYAAKLAARDAALRDAAMFDASVQQQQYSQQQQHQAEQKKTQEALLEKVTTYSGRADKLGIDSTELQAAGNTVAQGGLDNSVVDYILTEEQGPAITTYLANNPLELDTIREMSPMQAGVYIANTVKAKAISSRPSPNPPPAPVDNPGGAGMPESAGLKGVVYE